MQSEQGVSVKSDVATLRAFLRTRCGSPQAAFYALDVHNLGQLTSDDFVKGLKRLGYTADAAAAFRVLDKAGSGLMTRDEFEDGLLRCGETSASAKAKCMLVPLVTDDVGEDVCSSTQASDSLDAWKKAMSPSIVKEVEGKRRTGSRPATQRILDTSLQSGNASMRLSRSSESMRSVVSSHHEDAIARADLYARLGRVEELLSTELQSRTELQTRVAAVESQIGGLVTEATVTRHYDSMMQKLADERQQSQSELSNLRSSVQAAKQWPTSGEAEVLIQQEADRAAAEQRLKLEASLQQLVAERMNAVDLQLNDFALRIASVADQCRELGNVEGGCHRQSCLEMNSVRQEIERAIGEARPRLEEEWTRVLGQRLNAFDANLAGLEKSQAIANARYSDFDEALTELRSRVEDVQQWQVVGEAEALVHREIGRVISAEQSNIEGLQGRVDALEKTVDAFRHSIAVDVEKTRAALATVKAAKPQDRQPDVPTAKDFEGAIGARFEVLRQEMHAAFDEERQRGCERAKGLGRTLGVEFEASIAKAKAELGDEIQQLQKRLCSSRGPVARSVHTEDQLGSGSVLPATSVVACGGAEDQLCKLKKEMRDLDSKIAGNVAGIQERVQGQDASFARLRSDIAALSARLPKEYVSAVEFDVLQDRIQEVKRTQDEFAVQLVNSATQRDSEADACRKKLQLLISKLEDTYADAASSSSSGGISATTSEPNVSSRGETSVCQSAQANPSGSNFQTIQSSPVTARGVSRSIRTNSPATQLIAPAQRERSGVRAHHGSPPPVAGREAGVPGLSLSTRSVPGSSATASAVPSIGGCKGARSPSAPRLPKSASTDARTTDNKVAEAIEAIEALREQNMQLREENQELVDAVAAERVRNEEAAPGSGARSVGAPPRLLGRLLPHPSNTDYSASAEHVGAAGQRASKCSMSPQPAVRTTVGAPGHHTITAAPKPPCAVASPVPGSGAPSPVLGSSAQIRSVPERLRSAPSVQTQRRDAVVIPSGAAHGARRL